MNIKLKICGMKVPDNIHQVASLSPDYMGFIFYRPSKRYIDGLEPEFVKGLDASIRKVGVFVDEDPEAIIQLTGIYGLNAVQLHGAETPETCAYLMPFLLEKGVELIKAFGVDASFDFTQLAAYNTVADYFLFDTQTAGHGGSGKLFDWTLLQKYEGMKPYFLSGGISSEHLNELHQLDDPRLYALDVNSRFETVPGLKDFDKLNDFIKKL